ncbi:phosphatidylinositol 3 and 4-kinase-domain-containing protein [Dichotomocladium elegans]|nr:phosphatidylinositol 3 and 4-kinase-domain-containing protein [Dichotomocladium elegans]
MFSRGRHPSAPSTGQGAYTRLQQQDDLDDDLDDLIAHTCIARHPNSIIVTNNYHSTVAPILAKSPSLPTAQNNESGGGVSITIAEDDESSSSSQHLHTQPPSQPPPPPSFSQRASFSARRAAEIPTATRHFIQSKLPFRRKTASEASFASLPQVVIADIQQGDMPAQSDPLLKELPKRGWTIVRRRRFRGRRRMLGNKKNERGILAPLPFDKSLVQTDTISASVFVKWDPSRSTSSNIDMISIQSYHHTATTSVKPAPKDIPVSTPEFNLIVQSVRTAIEDAGVQPTRISQGSSGSYFCRNSSGKTVGVFKPKNEEPYGRLNPKWTKWIHRHLFPCCFGRSCLIPNLGYISEAAASLIDRRLGTCIVPHTGIVHLASPSFHYDYLDRRSAAIVGLPPKIGSFQCFLDGFKDANLFLRDNPYPAENYTASSLVGRSTSAVWAGCMGQQQTTDWDEGNESIAEMNDESDHSAQQSPAATKRFRWTRRLQDNFKLEFEQLVILDYLIRNTDRGLDNWMIKYCDRASNSGSSSPTNNSSNATLADCARDYIQIAAIDNGLAFPFKHPDEWRSYPYGWLALPDTLIARPFSEQTRHQFLGVLSDPVWWRETVYQMRELFQNDADFDEQMFERQMAVLKGQGFNIVRVLSNPNASPLDLVATERVLVNQEEILIEYDEDLIRQRSPSYSAKSSQPPSNRRLRTKRSTSFDMTMHRPLSADNGNPEEEHGVNTERPWKDRMWGRVSIDLGRRRRKRLMKNLRLGMGTAGSDGEDNDSDSSSDDEDEGKSRKRVTIIMETIEVVKSRTPYFTCC